MILLTDLLERAGVVPDALHGNCAVGSIEQDSRQVTTGSLFVCMPGHNANSHDFIPAAKQAGAVGVIAHSREGLDLAEVHGLSGAMIRHDGSRFNEALCKICREYFHNPT
ncbi:MAG TPA: Mur ligase domain-containing protein, partial [Fimbriimonadaceae bacterium]|nr:Mur ligase domain-containing protein [Fimbriimonadaceae bacterium]